jgi:hypothetical protein
VSVIGDFRVVIDLQRDWYSRKNSLRHLHNRRQMLADTLDLSEGVYVSGRSIA